jgi:hypothetical protein
LLIWRRGHLAPIGPQVPFLEQLSGDLLQKARGVLQ